MKYENEIRVLRQRITKIEEKSERLRRLESKLDAYCEQYHYINNRGLEIASDTWRDFTVRQAEQGSEHIERGWKSSEVRKVEQAIQHIKHKRYQLENSVDDILFEIQRLNILGSE